MRFFFYFPLLPSLPSPAGNPPEYNRSVREFDVATLDRLKVISVDPDLKIWREYAYGRNIHGAVLGYLDVKKDDFYVMEMSPEF